MNTNKILGRMREKHITQSKLKELLADKGVNIGMSTLNMKLQGKSEFRASEVIALIEILEMNACDVFGDCE